jgi:mono/diheme cytochrome c family protein
VVVIGISTPFAFHEAAMRAAGAAEGTYSEKNLRRVEKLLVETGLSESEATEYATVEALETGRGVLHGRCVECHDLRTVLARPRTAVNWRQTVRRMAAMTTEEHPLTETDQWHVTAYLIALSPRLQQSRQTEREASLEAERSKEALETAATATPEPTDYEPERAEALFETKCSQCHSLELVEEVELTSTEDARALVARMVELGAEGTAEEFRQIIEYLDRNYVETPGE